MMTVGTALGTVARVTSRRLLRARTRTLVAVDVVTALVAIAVSWAVLTAGSIDWPAGTRNPDALAAVLVVTINAPIAFRRAAWFVAWVISLGTGLVYLALHYPPVVGPAVASSSTRRPPA
jgi:hypothetical protein